MCKVFAMSNMKNVKVTKKFIRTVKDAVISKGDNDGFGYAVLTEDGSIGGERTTRPSDFNALIGDPDLREVSKLPIVVKTRNIFGSMDMKNPKAFIGHGRLSTNDATLENTHPYYNGQVALIHNGVVRDPENRIKNLTTTNDTEILLRCWEKGKMAMVEQTVTGYYAMAILDKTGFLHIVRDDRAMLYISYCRQVDSYIFATTAEIIRQVAKEMKWATEEPEEMMENVHVILDRNDFEFAEIKPRSEGRYMGHSERKALGLPNAGYADYQDYRDNSSYENWGGTLSSSTTTLHEGAGTIVDASKEVAAATGAVIDEEPSYREGKREAEKLVAMVDGDFDRALVDDGGISVNDTIEYDDNVEVDGYVDAYVLNRKLGNF